MASASSREKWILRWVLFGAVVVASCTTSALVIYSLGESARICRAVDRGNEGNRAAWTYAETAVKEAWKFVPPTEKERKQTNDFFDGIRERLRPINC